MIETCSTSLGGRYVMVEYQLLLHRNIHSGRYWFHAVDVRMYSTGQFIIMDIFAKKKKISQKLNDT